MRDFLWFLQELGWINILVIILMGLAELAFIGFFLGLVFNW